MSAPRDFWPSCGHHLLDRDDAGGLRVTDEFLKAYLARPELMPPLEACAAERALHHTLLLDPRQPIDSGQLARIADQDARENWQTMIAWRDHLLRHRSLESAYLEIVRRKMKFPHILVNQLVQVIMRNALDGCDDVFMLRAAEMYFRTQKLMRQDMSLVAIDEETGSPGDRYASSPLMTLLRLPTIEIDVLSASTADRYWGRSDRFELAIDLSAGERGMLALGGVISRWLSHLLDIDVEIEPLRELQDAPFSWHLGLSAEGSRIGDALWNGNDLDDAARARLIELFRLTFRDSADVIEEVSGDAVYLLLATTIDEVLRLKPQNLVAGLSIRQVEMVN
jgi:Family of unknown function (DUF6352)